MDKFMSAYTVDELLDIVYHLNIDECVEIAGNREPDGEYTCWHGIHKIYTPCDCTIVYCDYYGGGAPLAIAWGNEDKADMTEQFEMLTKWLQENDLIQPDGTVFAP